MRCTSYRLLAVLSLLFALTGIDASSRPRYAGTLRVEMRESVRTLDPGDWPADTSMAAAKAKLVPLMFDTLVMLGDDGRPRPGLALSWQHDPEYKKWRFRMRPGVTLDDGSVLKAETVAAALHPSGEVWRIGGAGDELSIDTELPAPGLLYDLADPSKSICIRSENARLSGTGPFRLSRWEPGRRALLVANELYWAGRPFLDAVSIEMGRPFRDQLLDLEVDRADFVEIWPGDVRRTAQRGAKVWSTAPNMLVALVFERGKPAIEDARVREAVALTIDRAAMHSVLVQKQGEPASALLPQQLSGYAYLFSSGTDPARARQLVSGLGQVPPLLLAYDGSDPLARPIAERISVNAREGGMTIQVSAQPAGADMRLVRLPIREPLPGPALGFIASFFHLVDVPHSSGESIDSLYAFERALIDSYRVIPLLHLPELFGSSARLKTWQTRGVDKSGKWHLDDMWLDTEKP